MATGTKKTSDVSVEKETKVVEKEAPKKTTAKKSTAKKTETSDAAEKTAVKRTTAKKAEAADAVKEEAPKKTTARKTAAKKTEPEATVTIQFQGKDIAAKAVLEAAKEAFAKANPDVEIETIDIYVKPEENAAYYVVNGTGAEDYKIQL